MTTPSTSFVWFQATRPKTLLAALAPVLIGTSMAFEAGLEHWPSAVLALLGATFIQIGTNFYNDYADFLKGADTEERVGPKRATQAGLVRPDQMKIASYLAFGLAVIAGSYLMIRGGWPVILIGIASIVSGFLYTAGKYSLAYIGLGDLFVLIFFGPIAVGGTYYVQALEISPLVIFAGLSPGLLAVAILLVNNIRDIHQDTVANKRTLVVRLGRPFGIGFYAFCITAALLVPVAIVIRTGEHYPVLGTLIVGILAWPIVKKLISEKDPESLNPLLGGTARILLLYSVFFSFLWVAGS